MEKIPDFQRPDSNQKKDKQISRRTFLKGAVLGAAGTVAIYEIEKINKLIRYFSELAEQKENLQAGENGEPMEKTDIPLDAINFQDTETVYEALRFDPEKPVQIDLRTARATEDYWYRQYQKNPKLKRSLEGGLKRMEPYIPELKKIFKEEGVPEDFLYLALPESHWQLKAASRKRIKTRRGKWRWVKIAVGPYQFTKKTAKMYGLKVNRKIDERTHPLKSGRACARLLRDLYEATGDWNLSLSGYNGGFVWRYFKYAKRQRQKVSYENFLEYIEQQAENRRRKIKNLKYFVRQVKRGDTLFKLAQYAGIDLPELKRLNRIPARSNLIKVNQKIRYPAKEEKKKKLFKRMVSGFSQNLNYPPKFNAIMRILKEKHM